MNIGKDNGITLVALVITIIVLIIIAGVSITGAIRGNQETQEASDFSELNMVQHALLERYTKAQLTKEDLPGTGVEINEVQSIIDEINNLTQNSIELKGNDVDYKELSEQDLNELGITNENDVFIVNYKTGEVINKTKKVTKSGKALYISRD
jgi:type II secretory pathway pseudopilin PulG